MHSTVAALIRSRKGWGDQTPIINDKINLYNSYTFMVEYIVHKCIVSFETQLLFCIPENLSFLALYAWLAALKLNNKMLKRVLLLFCGQNPVNFASNGSFISVVVNLFFHRAALWSKCKSHGPHSCHLHVTSSIPTNQIYNIIYSLNIIISKRLHLFKSIILLTNNKKTPDAVGNQFCEILLEMSNSTMKLRL